MKQLLIVFVMLIFFSSAFSQEKLSLEQCINIAMENNSTLKIATNDNKAATFDVIAGYSGILPRLSVSAGHGKQIEGPARYLGTVPVGLDSAGQVIYEQRIQTQEKTSRNTNSTSINLSQNIFDGGVWLNQIRKGHVDKVSSDMNLRSERNRTIMDITNAYLNLLKQEKLYQVNALAVDRSQGQVTRAEKMFELGSSAKLDVYQAKVNLGNDKINLLTQKNTVSDAKRLLNITMGRDPMEFIEVLPIVEKFQSLPSLDDLNEVAMENQPLLRKNEADLKSVELMTYMRYGILSPSVSFYYNYAHFSDEFKKVYEDFSRNYNSRYGISINFNLFNGMTDYVNIQKNRIQEKNSREYQLNYERNLKGRINQYYENYKSYEEIIAINQENLEAAKEELRLAEERYQIGAGTSLDVREAQVKLTRAEQTLIAAQYNALITMSQIDNELGISEIKLKEQIN